MIGVIATVLVNLRPVQAKPYLPILTLISGTFMVVFYVAAVLGIALVIVSLVGNQLSKGQAGEHTREPSAALGGARRAPTAAASTYVADAPSYTGPTTPAAPYPPQTGYIPPAYEPPASAPPISYPPPPHLGDGGSYPPPPQGETYRPYPEPPPQS
jgi:hypothetical protein